jgi:Na+/H+ antiporter NhaC
MASASDHIDHVRTQLPYALLTGALTALLYLILGYVM